MKQKFVTIKLICHFPRQSHFLTLTCYGHLPRWIRKKMKIQKSRQISNYIRHLSNAHPSHLFARPPLKKVIVLSVCYYVKGFIYMSYQQKKCRVLYLLMKSSLFPKFECCEIFNHLYIWKWYRHKDLRTTHKTQ